MSVSGKRGVGIPVILLHDAEGGIVTIELKNGFTYRGILDEAQDNMNCTMKECMKTDLVGRESKIDVAYIRGSQIKFVVLPDMLQNAPFFNRIKMWRKFKGHAVFGSGLAGGPARGQSAAIIQKSQQRRMEVEGGGRGDSGGRGGGFGGRGDGGGRGGGGGGGYQGHGQGGGFQQGQGQGPQGGYQQQGGYNQGGPNQGQGGYQQQGGQGQGGYGGPPGPGGFMGGGGGGRGDFGGRGGGMGGRGGYQGNGPQQQQQGGFQQGPGQGQFNNNGNNNNNNNNGNRDNGNYNSGGGGNRPY